MANRLSAEERKMIKEIANSAEFADKTPYEIVSTLADRGVYIASESTFYRVLKEFKMTKHRAKIAARTNRPVPCYYAAGPNQVWVWDITYIQSSVRGLFYYLYVIMDLFSRKVVGWEIWEEQSDIHARDLLLRAATAENITRINDLVLHSDNGSSMKGQNMINMMYWLGIKPSFNRPRVSNDNAYAESLFNTYKHHTPFHYPEYFDSIDAARKWAQRFFKWYNSERQHSSICYITPNDSHNGLGEKIAFTRNQVMEMAKQKHPERWGSRKTKDWSSPKVVFLNPSNKYSQDFINSQYYALLNTEPPIVQTN